MDNNTMFAVDGIDDACETWEDWVYAESHRRYLSIYASSTSQRTHDRSAGEASSP